MSGPTKKTVYDTIISYFVQSSDHRKCRHVLRYEYHSP